MKTKLIPFLALLTSPLAQASAIYHCETLYEAGNNTPVFSKLTLKAGLKKMDVSGKFSSIGSGKIEKIRTTAIRSGGSIKPTSTNVLKYKITNPFKMDIYLPGAALADHSTKIHTTVGYIDGDNGYVKASGACYLLKE